MCSKICAAHWTGRGKLSTRTESLSSPLSLCGCGHGQSRKFALYWTGPWQIKNQLNKLMYEITPHHSWARQGSKAVLINRLKPFHAIYIDALEYHCPPATKDDLKMLGNEFAEFLDDDLADEIDACPPAAQQLPASAQQAPPLPAAAAAAAAADPPPFEHLEHAAHPVTPAVSDNKEDAAPAPQMPIGQRPYGQRQRQKRMDAEAANGPYWLPGQPLPPAPLVRDAIPTENLSGQRGNEYQRQRVREVEQLQIHDQRANRRDRAATRNTRDPDHKAAMRDPGPVELEAMMATLSLSKNWISDSAWQYYARKYNLLKEDDCKRSQSIPKVMRDDERWCYKKEHINQEALWTGLLKERGRGRGSLHGYTD
jgi:hypothetical protein